MKKLIVPVIILVIAVAIGYTLYANKTEAEAKSEEAMRTTEVIPVTVQTAEMKPLVTAFSANGNLAANRTVTVVSEQAGKVVQVLKKKGDYVKQGEVIAKIDDTVFRSELLVAEANFAQFEKDLQRYTNLAESNAVTPKQFEDVQNGLKNAQSHLIMSRKRLNDTAIKAPFSGFLNNDYIEAGTYLTIGAKVADLMDLSTLKLEVQLTENEVDALTIGDMVDVSFPSINAKGIKGKVTFIAKGTDSASRYPVEISIDGAQSEDLRPGMFGTADFSYTATGNGLLISRIAIAGSIKNPHVYVVNGEHVEYRAVKIVSMGENQIQVTEGLEEGDKVVLTGQINLKDGSRIVVQ